MKHDIIYPLIMELAKFAENGGQFPVKGLGSSDCKCFSHLLYFSVNIEDTFLEFAFANSNNF